MYRQSNKTRARKNNAMILTKKRNQLFTDGKAIEKTKNKLKGSITVKRMIAVRLSEGYILKLESIANKKKATKTKVIGDLIDLAYAGLNDPIPKALNKLYSQILKGIDQENQKAD
jgi:hypothetical protein